MSAAALSADLTAVADQVSDALATAATVPVKLLISGGIGTGKSTVLGAARDALRGAGLTVITRPSQPGDPPDAVLVIDDAHLLGESEVLALTQRAADPRTTMVLAAEPQAQLRNLAVAMERHRPRLSLPPLTVPEELMGCTAGLPFLVRATTESARPAAEAAAFALIARLRRLDEPDLDTLLIMSLDQDLGAADIAAALGNSISDAHRLVDRARAGGLVEPSHSRTFLQLVHGAVARVVGNAHHRDVEAALLHSQFDMSATSPPLALQLAEHGLHDDRLATLLARHAADARRDSSTAARLYQAALNAGAVGLTAHVADALARSGACGAAAALADDLLGSPDAAERAAAVRIAASVATHDGSAAQAAELFGWLGPQPDAVVGAAAAIVFAATGDLAAARDALPPNDSGPPTRAARSARSLAEGLLLTVDQPYPVAMTKLGQAIASAPATIDVVMPDSPAGLVTLAAIHAGDPVRARSVIGRATRADGDVVFRSRHILLSAWIKMQDGQLALAAAEAATEITQADSVELHRRDALWAAALQTAIARRSGDTGALHKHWYAGMEVLAEHSVDLFTLLPLGELWVAAARMRQVEQLRHALDQAFTLLDSLGNPALWSTPLHWAGVHAGILLNAPELVAPHGQALGAAAGVSALAHALSGAGRTWLRVLANQVDVDEVTAAARALAQVGLTSDATRLAGQAALQTPDGKISGAMLQLARDLKVGAAPDDAPAPAPQDERRDAASSPPSGSQLSRREREVAELLVLGMPYRDIGAQLFISAKTVEHHVARIRRRLGAGSRSELLSMIRAMLATEG
ncbi:isoniazid response ATPase/transcriptional regulator IniR [Mycobacterium sherrisii]|uniref:isoniazid response ATPase/transcriptional regulator IniR n=1 Tax=Mycobacterium sherrisii TaxID=243061 RepID=UPI000A162107|nr:isoniazid response ATPase/transcriptional regulator IniR [Mycobacterium sherrisii]MCV7028453.1 helix-turn-helix transcriptional regulator [Mycobacterium sherrisii]MEC4764075.1 isoniazid response ATPase/transcriptional regulator IniR [Mycobacterium sherrisii]ORW76250.1 helix-turn-helix transcriptional regulator [Mycobacterium sherrisii]